MSYGRDYFLRMNRKRFENVKKTKFILDTRKRPLCTVEFLQTLDNTDLHFRKYFRKKSCITITFASSFSPVLIQTCRQL